jgi:hypothetical protein
MTFRRVIGLLCLVVIVVGSAPVTVFADGTSGYDVSYAQCGQLLPTNRSSVTIVGVEGGRSFTLNPCFGDLIHWANVTGRHLEFYINTSFPAGSKIHHGDTGPKGTCQSDDWACRAYNYGFNNAEFAFHDAQVSGAVADTWWLDVETANSWDVSPTLNDAVIQGAVDSLRAHRLLVGIYSIPPDWSAIAGTYATNVPKWDVQLQQSVPVTNYCLAANGFGGGAIAMVQVDGGTIDRDYPCPVNPFATQATYVPFPLTGPQTADLSGTIGGSSTFYALPAITPGSSQSLTFDFTPWSADEANALFLTLSQKDLVLAHVRGTDTPTPGHVQLSVTSQSSDPIVVRVDNYNRENLLPVHFRISRE